MELTVQNLEEFNDAAADFARRLVPRPGGATVVALSGELGAGKTAFTKNVAKTLGIKEIVNSPTFVLEKIYALPSGAPFARLVHIDAYRLHGAEEIAPLKLAELLPDPKNLIFIEWPEQVGGGLPEPAYAISFMLLPSGARTIAVTP